LSWFHNLIETYDRCSDIVGISDEKGHILLPPNHMAANTDICVTIDGNGKFYRAEESKQNILIPCTEDSSTRAGKVEYPHPLHDQIGYLALEGKKRLAYLLQLSKWSTYHTKIEAVHKYINGGTLISDLLASEINVDDPKSFIRFSVEISLNDLTPHLWEDNSVAIAWQEYCTQSQSEDKTLCYITGEVVSVRTKHPKGTNPSVNGAKLISCNDKENYTYKGRFTKSNQANAIGAKSSHQAHAMLRYLIASQGYKCDSQAIVAWAVNDGKAALDPFADSKGLSDSFGIYSDAQQTDLDKVIETKGEIDADYAKKLRNALAGKGNVKHLHGRKRQIAVIATDAATTGRMAITFYKNLSENEYIDRVIDWHESCCWWFRNKEIGYISAPNTDSIIAAVYGEPKGDNYAKIKKQARERLLHLILNGEQIDRMWLSAAVQRVSNPFSYDKPDGGWDKYKWEIAISVTCAIVKKYYTNKEEVFSLELEKTCNNREYLYGRLLALADKIESHARYLQTGKNDTDKRPTNAVRYMTAFAAKPFRTWMLIYHQLNPYLQRLNGGEWYQQQIDEIISLFAKNEFDSDKPLNGKYLMGYSLQRRTLNNKNNEEETKNVE
jgi:CRISPR-associated protein Csd1